VILNPLLSNNDSRVFVQWGDWIILSYKY
jgi:hypothetical protein